MEHYWSVTEALQALRSITEALWNVTGALWSRCWT